MKLRMRSNSIRLRLTRSEIALFAKEGRVEEQIAFASGALSYVLQRSSSAITVAADLKNDILTVTVPGAIAEQWISTPQVGIEAQAPGLNILIEKDFQCDHGPLDEDAYARSGRETGI